MRTDLICTAALSLAMAACHRESPRPAVRATAARQATPAPSSNDAHLSNDAAIELANAFQREGSPANIDGNTVRASGHALTTHVQIAQVIADDVTTAALDVAVDLDGRPTEAFHVTAIAHDRDREEALAHAIREWAVGYALPIVHAVRSTHTSLEAHDAGATFTLHLGPYNVYPGPIGARGELPVDWDARTAGMHAALLARIEPGLHEILPEQNFQAEPFHALRFTVHVRAGVVGEGDCRVDNVPNERLCELIREYEWPSSPNETDGYIVKQYYVLVRPPR
jgi:hypothetical protein